MNQHHPTTHRKAHTMTETQAEPRIQPFDESTLSPTQQDMLTLMRQAVADIQRAKVSDDMKLEKFVLPYLGGDNPDANLNDDDLNVTVGEILSAFREAKAASGDMSDEDRAALRKSAREAYNSAQNVLKYMPLPDNFPASQVPQLPGSTGGASSGQGEGGEKPRNLHHTVTDADGKVLVAPAEGKSATFATVSQKIKVPTADLLAQFKSVAGETKEAWESSIDKRWEWSVESGGKSYTIVTEYVEK